MINEDRIRKRKSYQMFKELYDFLNDKPSKGAILNRIHCLLDYRRSYGSERNATYAFGSLELLLKDRKNGGDK